MGADLRLGPLRHYFRRGKAITAETQAAAASSSFGSSLRFQRLFGNRLVGVRGAGIVKWVRKVGS